jgi:hypothetical protein
VRTFLRGLRGTLSLAALWAAVWLPAGIILGFVLDWAEHSLRPPFWYLGWTALGASSGASFALLLALFERRRSFQELSTRRLTVWGAAAGAALPIAGTRLLVALMPDLRLSSDTPILFAVLALLGASCAWATLAIARRGATVERAAPPSSER